jgi:hypothetical protein
MFFFADRIRGRGDFATAFDALAIPSDRRAAAVARLLDVSPRTVRDWLTGKREPPRAAVVALWHESRHGRAVTSAHSEYGAYLARSMADTLARDLDAARETIAALSQELAAAKLASAAPLASNDPRFNWRNPGTRPRSGAPCIPA